MSRFNHKVFLAELTSLPGVYQMLGSAGEALYVGKAKNLKNRVSSYFRGKAANKKTEALVARIADIQITVTASETEALLLEWNLIKSLKPPYNILLRDDKSYPQIFLTEAQEYPSIGLHRGARRKSVRYFGPFPSGAAVRQTLQILQRAFKVRQCDDTYFNNRSRPCLQYQINRCTGPCVGLISPQDYAETVRHTSMFLTGKSREIIDELSHEMDALAARHEYERAAEVRDQIIHLRHIQEQQHVSRDAGDLDVIAARLMPTGFCVHVLFIRAGGILGSRTYYPKVKMVASEQELLSAFIPQFYLGNQAKHPVPKEILINHPLDDADVIAAALEGESGHRVKISSKVRGDRARWLKLAVSNAEQNLAGNYANRMGYQARLQALQQLLGLDNPPKRMECFDISHSSGEATVASCVVFDENGPLKSDYRSFNIEGVTAGDDYAAMEQALQRRYKRLSQGEGKLPDILFVDGGKGQLRVAEEILAEFGLNQVLLIGVAKGATRKPGLETLLMPGRGDIPLAADAPALHLIQHIRDEAHRFAISSHRKSRGKARKTSKLEQIPGVGAKRRRDLLRYFGGMQLLARASEEDIAKVEGISKKMAAQIYAYLHND